VSYSSFGWLLDNKIEIHEVVKKSSKDVYDEIERNNLYQKRFRNTDELESIICGLKWM